MSLIRLITALFAAPFAALALLMPGVALGASYAASATVFSWISTTGHTTVALTDDSVTAELALGFSFSFGGVNYTTARIQSNGRLQFNNAITDYNGGTYPGAGVTNTMAGAYYDLNPAKGGSVTYKAIGAAPNRQFVATFTNVPAYSSPSLRYNFQLVLNEDGSFVYQYGAMGSAVYVGYETTVSDYVVVSSAYAAPAN